MSIVKRTTIDSFAKDVVDLMKKYTTDVEEAISEEVKRVGEQGAMELQNTLQPPATESGTANVMTRRQWNTYAKNWEAKVDERAHYTSSTIHNKRHYRLTHLLEYGHATRDGKRTRAFAHVKPVEDEIEKELSENIIKIVEKGGKL